MLGETLEERMARKEKAAAKPAPGFVDVPKEMRANLLPAAREYVKIATGYGVGSMKFEYHMALANEIFDYLFPDSEEHGKDYRGMDIHDEMLDVVDFLDETIGLPFRELASREVTIFANKLINRLWVDLEKYRECTRLEKI